MGRVLLFQLVDMEPKESELPVGHDRGVPVGEGGAGTLLVHGCYNIRKVDFCQQKIAVYFCLTGMANLINITSTVKIFLYRNSGNLNSRA